MISELQKVPVMEFSNKVIKNPIVSVCVATYQHKSYIKDCLDGILMQKTKFEFELILGEDQSSDGTREICQEYAKKYPSRIRLMLHSRENNIEIAGKPSGRFVFIHNLMNARGKYIAFCEGDDFWTDPLKLQKQFEFLEANPGYSICAHSVKTFYDDTWTIEKVDRFLKPLKTAEFEDLLDYHYLPTNSLFLRNNSIKELPIWTFGDTNLLAGDILLCLIVSAHGKVFYMDEVMASKRINGGGVTANIKGRRKYKLVYKLAVYSIMNRHTKGKYKKLLLPKIIVQYARCFREYLKKGDFKSLIKNFKYVRIYN